MPKILIRQRTTASVSNSIRATGQETETYACVLRSQTKTKKWMGEKLIVEGKVVTAHKDKNMDVNTDIVQKAIEMNVKLPLQKFTSAQYLCL